MDKMSNRIDKFSDYDWRIKTDNRTEVREYMMVIGPDLASLIRGKGYILISDEEKIQTLVYLFTFTIGVYDEQKY